MSNPTKDHAVLATMDKVFRGIVVLCRVTAGVALVAMTLLLGYQVFGRYVLNDTPTWVDPLSLLLVMLIAFLGAGIGVQEDTHLSVVIFRKMVPPHVRTVLVFITDLIMAMFGGLMLWYGAQLTMFKWNTLIPMIQWSEGFRSLPLTICGGLIMLFSLGHMFRLFLGRDHRVDTIE